MSAPSTPAVLSRAEKALAEATTVEAVKAIYDTAEAYRVYAKSAADQNLAATFKLRAAAKGGALLDADPKLGPGKGASLAPLFPDLSRDGAKHLSSRWQHVAHLDELGTLEAYLSAAAQTDDGEVTMAGLMAYAKAGTLNSSESPEWYTPERYVDAAREVLGSIDLDPASSAAANEVVRAKQFYSATDDGLAQPWYGRVFLNPPYGTSAPKGSATFVPKLVTEYQSGRTTAAVLLTSAHGTDTEWFSLLWDYTLCFTDHRLAFWNEDGDSAGPTFGSAFTYLGPDRDAFAHVFGAFGAIVVRWTP
jgi:ParB family chromosome partitioning protein